ncbi:MAG: hydrogenase maturation protease [candidate division Zixibacteria bacterium]|nr:hydrogenase maturation protease [candidate division Zixibacteria bacterium]
MTGSGDNGAKVRVIGLGNDFRGDDAIGLEVARIVAARTQAAEAVVGVADGSLLLHLWTELPLCIVVDCAVSGKTPGTIHVLDGLADHMPRNLFSSFSTHAYSIPSAIELGRNLNQMPVQLTVYGIEGDSFACGKPISAAVRRAGERVVERILAEIDAHLRSHEPVPAGT